MNIKGTAKSFYQAYRYINGNFTKKQQEEAQFILEVDTDSVRLIAVGEEAYYISTLENIEINDTGIHQVDLSFIEALSDRLKDIEWNIYSEADSLIAVSQEGEIVEGLGDEVELMIESLPKIASFNHTDIASMLTELLANTVKTGRNFTDTLLLRLRKDQLNGRTLTMQSIVINSIQSQTDNQGLIDLYLPKPKAQALNKAIKLFNKKEELFLVKDDDQIGFQSGNDLCVLLEMADEIDLPDITGLMRRINRLKENEAIVLNVEDWKKELNALQKETPEKERDSLKQWLNGDGLVQEERVDGSVLISVKSLIKIIRSIQAKEVQLYITDLCLVFKYETETRTHNSVVMIGKE